MTRLKLIILINILCLVWLGCANADPPHPSKHYKWEVWPNGNVILSYLINGQELKYVYRLVHEVEPATHCVHTYGTKTFRLITFDTTHPYWYTIDIVPVRVWDTKLKQFVGME